MAEQWKKQETQFWEPEKEGDELIGDVTDIREGDFGKQYEVKNGEASYVTPSHKVLQNRMAKAEVGTKVKIVFTGTEEPTKKGHNPTKMYEVYFATA